MQGILGGSEHGMELGKNFSALVAAKYSVNARYRRGEAASHV